MGLPLMSASGLPGRRVEAMRAGITTIGFSTGGFAAVGFNAKGLPGNVPPDGLAGVEPAKASSGWVEEAISLPYGVPAYGCARPRATAGRRLCSRPFIRGPVPRSIRKPGCMDSMEINKVMAAVLIAGIMFFLTGLIGMHLVSVERLEKPAIAIQGAPAPE